MHPIRLRGARTHNLKGIDLDLSPGELAGVTGVSGAGSALGRVQPDKSVRLVRGDREAFGLHGRSAEQRVALDLLLDPEVGIVSLGGRAGTGAGRSDGNSIERPGRDASRAGCILDAARRQQCQNGRFPLCPEFFS